MNAPSHDPYGPYRAPQPGTPLQAFGGATTTLHLVFTIVATLGMFGFVAVFFLMSASITPESGPEDREAVGDVFSIALLVFGVAVVAIYAQSIAGLVWLYKAWSWLPPEERYARRWSSWITPGQAALMLLIPYFQYYWMFVINHGLCDALERMRASRPTAEHAPKELGTAASIAQILVPIPLGGILWFLYMRRIERMMRVMSEPAFVRA